MVHQHDDGAQLNHQEGQEAQSEALDGRLLARGGYFKLTI